VEALATAGAEIVAASRRRIMLRSDHGVQSFTVHRRARLPRPAEFTAPVPADALLVAPRLTAATEAKLMALGWSWATDAGQVRVRFGDQVVTSSVPGEPVHPMPEIRGTTAFLALRLLLQSPMRQSTLAAAMKVSQPRASQVLTGLAENDLVTRDSGVWQVPDWDLALSAWLAWYPGPGGTATWWSALDRDSWALTLAALDTLPAGAVVSGDVGADLIAPWRRPVHAVIYTSEWHDLGRAGLVQASAPGSGTIAVRVPDDRGVWPRKPVTRTFRGHRIAVADAVQVLWDVYRADDTDSTEAAQHLRQRLQESYGQARRYTDA
jgi:hypothetical protein